MVVIPGGTFTMGGRSAESSQDEFPRHQVTVNSFLMDATEVTNAQFKKFVEETGYVTTAERPVDWEELKKQVPPGTPKPPDSLLLPGSLLFRKTTTAVNLNDYSQWWEWKTGANWKHPDGPDSDVQHKMNHPAVHVSWYDAQAYAAWAGKRLPTEEEWEWASSGGDPNAVYPWGNTPTTEATSKANFWQGGFPYENKLEDGFATTAPVGTYPPNKFGLFDMAGNVWEWCSDVYDPRGYLTMPEEKLPTSPRNPETQNPNIEYTLRGGSFLCNDSYCSGYLVSRRRGSTPDSGHQHSGFRCVQDLK